MSLHISTGLLGLAAMLPSFTISCESLRLHAERSVSSYSVAVRVRTRDGEPVPGVLISNPDSKTKGATDAQGQIIFQVDGLEGTTVSFHVERTPDGIVELDDSTLYRLTLKSIVGKKSAGSQRSDVLTYDILMRRTREMYVVLVSTRGVPGLPVSANGIELGKLNSLGVGAFRIKGQPGDELKVVIQTGKSLLALTQDNPEQTFPLPATSAILSFASTLALRPESEEKSTATSVITFVPKKTKHSHRQRTTSALSKPESPKVVGPVQVPFRGVALK
jgi:hypothetical protein